MAYSRYNIAQAHRSLYVDMTYKNIIGIENNIFLIYLFFTVCMEKLANLIFYTHNLSESKV